MRVDRALPRQDRVQHGKENASGCERDQLPQPGREPDALDREPEADEREQHPVQVEELCRIEQALLCGPRGHREQAAHLPLARAHEAPEQLADLGERVVGGSAGDAGDRLALHRAAGGAGHLAREPHRLPQHRIGDAEDHHEVVGGDL